MIKNVIRYLFNNAITDLHLKKLERGIFNRMIVKKVLIPNVPLVFSSREQISRGTIESWF